MARPETNKTIDLGCIEINVNGLPNSASNVRCKDNNDSKDGFVYTASTSTEDDGKTYQYNYFLNKNSGIYADIIKGAAATDTHRALNAIRNADTTDKKVSESDINASEVWAGNQQFAGKVTKDKDFIYNEGYSTTLANGKNDSATYLVQAGTDEAGNPKYENVSFYDKNTAAFSNQLIAVRQLPKK